MVFLSNFVGGRVPDYIEFANVVTSGTVGPTVNRNDLWVTIYETHLIQNTGNLAGVSVDNSTYQMTLPAGTYSFNGLVNYRRGGDGSDAKMLLGLYNITDSNWVTQNFSQYGSPTGNGSTLSIIEGMFSITSSKVFELKGRVSSSAGGNVNFNIDSTYNTTVLATSNQFTNSNNEYRNNLRFWKLK